MRRRQRHQWGESSSAAPFVMEEQGNDPIRDMVMDANLHGIEYNMNEQASVEPIFEEAMGDAKEFFDLLQAANTTLYDRCDDGDTVLKWMSNWDYMLKCTRRWMKPEDRDRIPKDFYSTKKMMRRFSLGYKKYDVCVNNCFLYYGEFENKNYIACPICGEPRYKQGHVQQNQHIPRKSLWYLSITPRLKRLYMCRKIAEHMIWHLNYGGVSEKIVYPASAEAWKHFDQTYPDIASDPRNCVNMQEAKVSGMKSHDCYIFMQSLLPITFHDFLPKQVWEALTKISQFFKALCSPTIRVTDMEIWQGKIVETICQLERIFPPSFFDSMEHLAIHLPYEAKVGGPVQFHWMYPFERRMHGLKSLVKNKACPEGSICENYIISEISYFISLYFQGEVETRGDRIPRNLVGLGPSVNNGFSIFNNLGKPIGSLQQQRVLTAKERNAAMARSIIEMPDEQEYQHDKQNPFFKMMTLYLPNRLKPI
ncbi:hypothetical protein SLEP1_g23844 [Rubroshorea leprosula]|uniref:DUF4218 domain-containing protein n=1 Tax=Rubroshorea leprosula TaxID=152421 RepID=A0AAV5JN65_9ROSI|nr:hypothetical protein SLEP1_g23844 [Rubroshorea leprosula]